MNSSKRLSPFDMYFMVHFYNDRRASRAIFVVKTNIPKTLLKISQTNHFHQKGVGASSSTCHWISKSDFSK